MDGSEEEFAKGFAQSNGTNATYSGDSELIGNYAPGLAARDLFLVCSSLFYGGYYCIRV